MCIIFDIFKYENAKEQKELGGDHLFKRTNIYFAFSVPMSCMSWGALSHTIKTQADYHPALYFHLEHEVI